MFKISKATAGRIPDTIFVDMDKDNVVSGILVQFDGSLADAAGDVACGICNSTYAGVTGVPTDASFSPTFPLGADGSDEVKADVIPIDDSMLLEADVIGTTSAAIVVGYLADIATGGLGVSILSAQDDFRVTEIIATDGDGYATKVRGFLLDSGYYPR